MKTWSYGINSLPQFMRGSLYLIEQPAWLAFSGWFIESIIGRGCCLMHWIKMPRWLYIIDEDNEKISFNDYWGDLGAIWHCKIFMPCFNWHYAHPKRIEHCIEIGYNKVKEHFEKSNQKFFDEEAENIKEILKDE
jgi:hypothetical protein